MAIAPKLRFEVLKRDNFTCKYCGRTAPDVVLHVDHINPSVNGGTDTAKNLAVSCSDCNFGKGATLLSDFKLDRPDIVGKYFHIRTEKGDICRQGYVVSEPLLAVFLVQFFSFADGCPSNQKLYPVSEMFEWELYDSLEQMTEAWHSYCESTDLYKALRHAKR